MKTAGLITSSYAEMHPEEVEKIILTCQEFGIDCSEGGSVFARDADELRKATAKKKPELMAKIEPELKEGLMKRGWTQQQVDKLWEDILVFAKYSFNKSHSAAYALTAYITMFFKVYYPVEFITAYINSYDGDTKKISEVL